MAIRRVNYGYQNETNYGVFTNTSIGKGVVLGICSGIIFVTKHPDLEYIDTDNFSRKQIADTVCAQDYIAYAHSLLRQYETIDASSKKTPGKYVRQLSYQLEIEEGSSKHQRHTQMTLCPTNGVFTPMDFVNSANKLDEANLTFKVIDLGKDAKTGVHKHVPCYVSKRAIDPGEELLGHYMTKKNYRDASDLTAEVEVKDIQSDLNRRLAFIEELNSNLPQEKKVGTQGPVHCFYIEKMKTKTKPLVELTAFLSVTNEFL